MDSNYRPASPDLSSTTAFATGSDLPGGYKPASPDLTGATYPTTFITTTTTTTTLNNNHNHAFYPHPQLQPQHHQDYHHAGRFGSAFGGRHSSYGGYAPPTSIPQQQQNPYQPDFGNTMATPYRMVKNEDDDEYMPDAPAARKGRKGAASANGRGGMQDQKPLEDATLGVDLKTSFPVARIKRIMQADEDIGKVAQVTPHVVSRALELFMIKLISAAADQARGGAGAAAGGGEGGGTSKSAGAAKKVAPQHLKKAIMAEPTFDFLHPIMEKVPDAPSKAKKETKDSDSEEVEKKPKRRGKKRKDSDEI
ncbi:DNA polymerase epsilon subunit C [Teratosphaeria destructans]|uniref:DNA polymerase epsilon subunit C n=1 Tax=Teratosphaeria destructans TaxID=418781 RepID=A0A9W7SL01_9PEZI|nr:DNA polymerase epsilon subunit C [Teratosphaeria destructans]